MQRSQLITVLQVTDDRDIAVVGTHLSQVDDQGDTRIPQARTVVATVARYQDRGLPTIVAGDLNAQPGSVELSTFGGLLRNAFPPTTRTWPSWEPTVHIDHILVSDEFTIDDIRLLDTTLSDHLGLVVDVSLPTVQ